MQRISRMPAFTAVLIGLVTAVTAMTPAHAATGCDRPNPPAECRNPTPITDPPERSPVITINGADQTTDRTAVRIWGWTGDPDSPLASLSVSFSVNGVAAGSMTANQPRPDLVGIYSKLGGRHGFDITVPTSAAGRTICVTAVSVGGGPNKTACREMDDVAVFEANGISYDTSRAVLTNQALEQLDKVTNVNDTNVQQSTEISGSKSTTDTKGWSSTEQKSLNVSSTINVGIPIFVDGKVNVSATNQVSFVNNGQTAAQQTFSWRQPVIVPARSRIEATVAITRFTISVPYTLSGNWVYRSGLRVPGTTAGVFTGGNSTNLVVNLQQFSLDGSLSLAPVSQPAATMLKATPAR